ncbi:hypothetical protein DN540_37230, partial [Burkholderia multivorans]
MALPSVVFVCTGNICRSVTAERVLERHLETIGAEAVVDSGRGIRGDRVAAFTNGSLNVPADQWQRYSAFTVLKNYPDLQKWQVSTAPDSAITLT